MGQIAAEQAHYSYKQYTCPVCHKKFCIPTVSQWVYKQNSTSREIKLFCSWSCLRANENQENNKTKKSKNVSKEKIIPAIIAAMPLHQEMSTDDIVAKIKIQTGKEYNYASVRKRLSHLEDEGKVKLSRKVGKKTLWLKE